MLVLQNASYQNRLWSPPPASYNPPINAEEEPHIWCVYTVHMARLGLLSGTVDFRFNGSAGKFSLYFYIMALTVIRSNEKSN